MDDKDTAHGMSIAERNGYQICTVADLLNQLAGLPPMMEVFIDASGVSLYLNRTEVRQGEKGPPLLHLVSSDTPELSLLDLPTEWENMTYEERVDFQRARAREMGRRSQESMQMPGHVA
jgi:hypothetical protein